MDFLLQDCSGMDLIALRWMIFRRVLYKERASPDQNSGLRDGMGRERTTRNLMGATMFSSVAGV